MTASLGETRTNPAQNDRGASRPSRLTPRLSWLRGLDLNQRPLGYEGDSGLESHLSQSDKPKSILAYDRSGVGRLLTVSAGLPAQIPHKAGGRRIPARPAKVRNLSHPCWIANPKDHRNLAPARHSSAAVRKLCGGRSGP